MNRAILTASALALAIGCQRGDSGDENIAPDVAVHVVPVVRGTVHRYVTAYGTVEPEPAGEGRPAAGAVISPYQAGVLAAVNVVEGQRVDRGAILFRLDSRLADVAVQKARQEVDFADQAYRRQQELLRSEVTSQRAVEEAKQRLDGARSDLAAAEAGLAHMNIASPVSGAVVRIEARVGQAVDPSSVLASVIDVNRLVVSADVASREVAGLKPGQRVFLGSDTTEARGSVRLVGRDIDARNDTYRVLIAVPAGAGLTPGGFVQVRIVAEERRNVLVVPVESVVTRPGEGSWLMVAHGDSAVRTPVTAGLKDHGLVEVSGQGLAEGLTVVTTEAYSLPAATKIRIAGR